MTSKCVNEWEIYFASSGVHVVFLGWCVCERPCREQKPREQIVSHSSWKSCAIEIHNFSCSRVCGHSEHVCSGVVVLVQLDDEVPMYSDRRNGGMTSLPPNGTNIQFNDTPLAAVRFRLMTKE